MRHLIVVATVLALPSLAAAQAGGALGDPGEDAIVLVPAAPASPTLDPEIAALRGPVGAGEVRRADSGGAWGATFGSAFGGAWAGFGIGTAAGGLTGSGIGLGICAGASDGWMCPLFAVIGAGFGALAVAPLGAGIGAWAAGRGSGGTGNAFAAVGMAYLGGGVGAGLGALLGAGTGDGGAGATVGLIAGVVLTNLGAALGYELSSHGLRVDANDDDGALVVPMAGATDDGRGVTVGAAGTF